MEEEEERFSLRDFCREAASLLLMAYLFVIFFMLPFYMQNGYVEVGEAKYAFYKDITIGAFCLILPLAFIASLPARGKKRLLPAQRLSRFSVTDGMVLLYAAGVILSYLFTDYKQEALWGESGWKMGLITQLMFIVTYFLISRFWEYNEKIFLVFAVSSTGVFALGLLNRFSIFPIEITGANSSFLSTLGNINWYCGYWSVAYACGVFWFWIAKRKWERLASTVFLLLGTGTGVSQGSSSAFIALAAVCFLVFCLSFKDQLRMRRFLEIIIFICLCCQALRLWRFLRPEAYDYYDGTISDKITLSPITLYLLIPLILVYLFLILMSKKKKMDMNRYKMIRQVAVLLFFLLAGVFIMLLFLNSNTQGGIRFMGRQAVLVFDEGWGSSRGGTWTAGIKSFESMSPGKKLVGAGPDCFAMYSYTIRHVAEALEDQFGTARLTNAHCEWLTVLVNNGWIGFVGYAGIFISAFYRFVRAGLREKRCVYLYLSAGAVFAYTMHNIVSFQQIISTSFIFIMIGMGERLIREEKGVYS